MAATYVPAPGLVTIHNTARLLGQNEITTQGFATVQSMQGPVYNYAVGLIVPAVLMVIMFIIWGCSLICAKKCCKGTCSKNSALFFFVIFCLGSLAGWALALAGNVATTNGFNAMIQGVADVQGLAQKVIDAADHTTAAATNLFNLAENMVQSCNNSNVTFPFDGITNGLNQSLNAAGISGITGTAQSYNNEITLYRDLAAQYLVWRETGTMIVIIVTMVILFIFMLSTALRVMDSTPECCRPCVTCSSRGTSCIVFVFGLLLLLIIWIFVAIIHVIVTFGADLCVPDINNNLDRLVNEVARNDFSGNNPCLDPAFQSSTFGIICFYQTCNGTNPLTDQVSKLNVTGSEESLQQFRTQLNDTVTQYNITANNLTECFASMDSFFNGTEQIFHVVEGAIGLTNCSQINPVYASFVYSGLCNGLFNGLTFTYVSAIIACVFMMLSMSIFRIFDFNLYENGQLPQGHYIDGGDAKHHGQVIATGGPIMQDI